jgi:hypothetical protein
LNNSVEILKLNYKIDDYDVELISARASKALSFTEGPLVGDYIRFSDGTLKRVAHVWDDSIQPTGGFGESFYLTDCGGSFSGGLDPGIDLSKFVLTDERMMGKFWIFHNNYWTGHNGVEFLIPCKVWEVKDVAICPDVVAEHFN